VRADLAQLRDESRATAVALAGAAALRHALRRLEHQLDVHLRQAREHPTHGLAWAELERGSCRGCGVDARLWVGSWFEYVIAPGRLPFAIVSTPLLCAACVVRRQWAERTTPIWRPAPRPRRWP
jgi:hypothetical protein